MNRYRCTAYQGKGRKRKEVGETFVLASSNEKAVAVGRVVMRSWIRGKFSVAASPYYPWTDREISRFVRRVPDGEEQ